jgi:aminoglycoside 6'-N-acetyltransferase
MNINLRIADINDLETLKFWDTQKHVIDSDPNDDWNWEEELNKYPDWRKQYVAEIEKKPIGFIQIIDPYHEETHYWGDVSENLRAIDIWIGEEKDLGRGYGEQMMKLAIEDCFKDLNVTAILIDPLSSNTRAIKFYEKLGFRFLENRKFGEDDCHVMILKREDLA